jgi:hypothetical protein
VSGPTPDDYGADRLKRRAPSLLEHRPAGVAEARLLPPQAGGDGAGVGNFAGAKAIDVGRAGPASVPASPNQPTPNRPPTAGPGDRTPQQDGRGLRWLKLRKTLPS